MTPLADDMAETMARLERMERACKTLGDNFREWAADKPQSITCPHHQTARPLDFDESCRRSWKHSEFELVYQPCARCVSDADTIRVSDWLHNRGVPANLMHATLENWTPQTGAERAALAAAHDYAYRPRGFFVLLGGYGIGKTHLAVGIMRIRKTGLFKTGADLLDGLRATYAGRGGPDVVGECQRTKLLVLDELGASAGGKDELPMIHRILAHRHAEKLPTIITSQMEVEAFFEAVGARMGDRLKESLYKLVHMTGDSHRADVKEDYLA